MDSHFASTALNRYRFVKLPWNLKVVCIETVPSGHAAMKMLKESRWVLF